MFLSGKRPQAVPLMKNKKAVVLLSGGLDSATVLYLAKKKGYNIICLIFDYGQRHRKEILAAKKIAGKAGCRFNVIKFSLPWKGSSLLDKKASLPRNRSLKTISEKIPSTYVPARNTLFIAFALSCAEAVGAKTIFIGANAIDFSGYPDCRNEYFKVYNKLIEKGTRAGDIKIEAPLIKMTKAEIIKTGMKLKVPYELTWSCYSGGNEPCLVCDSCLLRTRGFFEVKKGAL